nr:hypothetical protein GCM10025732_58880 [Glycomyces mayteni]
MLRGELLGRLLLRGLVLPGLRRRTPGRGAARPRRTRLRGGPSGLRRGTPRLGLPRLLLPVPAALRLLAAAGDGCPPWYWPWSPCAEYGSPDPCGRPARGLHWPEPDRRPSSGCSSYAGPKGGVALTMILREWLRRVDLTPR